MEKKLNKKLAFFMTLDEALRRSPDGVAYTCREKKGFVFAAEDKIPRDGAGHVLDLDIESFKWRPTGGEKRWLP